MDPASVLSLVASIIGIGDVITRTVRSISHLQNKFRDVNLHVSLLIGQMMTLNAALKEISEWIDMNDCRRNEQLVLDLTMAIQGCTSLIGMIEKRTERLSIGTDKPLELTKKVRFLWEEKEVKEYLGHLSNQITALNLLLSALNCRSQSEQSALLARRESRRIFKRVEDDTSSMRLLRDNDSASGSSRTESVSESSSLFEAEFDFDQEIVASKAYRMAMHSNVKLLTLTKKEQKRKKQGLPLEGTTVVRIADTRLPEPDSSSESSDDADSLFWKLLDEDDIYDDDAPTIKESAIDTPPSTAGLTPPWADSSSKFKTTTLHTTSSEDDTADLMYRDDWPLPPSPSTDRFYASFGKLVAALSPEERATHQKHLDLINNHFIEQEAMVQELKAELFASKERSSDARPQATSPTKSAFTPRPRSSALTPGWIFPPEWKYARPSGKGLALASLDSSSHQLGDPIAVSPSEDATLSEPLLSPMPSKAPTLPPLPFRAMDFDNDTQLSSTFFDPKTDASTKPPTSSLQSIADAIVITSATSMQGTVLPKSNIARPPPPSPLHARSVNPNLPNPNLDTQALSTQTQPVNERPVSTKAEHTSSRIPPLNQPRVSPRDLNMLNLDVSPRALQIQLEDEQQPASDTVEILAISNPPHHAPRRDLRALNVDPSTRALQIQLENERQLASAMVEILAKDAQDDVWNYRRKVELANSLASTFSRESQKDMAA